MCRYLLIEHVVQNALLAVPEVVGWCRRPWHRPQQPRREVFTGQDACSPKPLPGIEEKLRRLCAGISLPHLLPIVIDSFGSLLRLCFVIDKKRCTTFGP